MRKLLLLPLLLLFAPHSQAQCTGGASPNWTWTLSANTTAGTNNLQGCINQTVNGDTITISAGSATWTTGVSVGLKGITIKGTGTPSSSPASSLPDASCTATVITDHLTTGNLIGMSPQFGNSLSRISCMNVIPFTPYSGYGSPFYVVGTCTSSGCPTFRMDNITLPGRWAGLGIGDDTFLVASNLFGVADHNNVGVSPAGGGNGVDLVNVAHGNWKGVGGWGDNSWASADTFGTNQAFYLENNTFTGAFGTDADEFGSSFGGGRYVCRFNTFNGVTPAGACANHGTDTDGRTRGARQFEDYFNTGTCTSSTQGCASLWGSRGGVGIIFGNNFSNVSGGFLTQYANSEAQRRWRKDNPWGACDGSGGFDQNDGGTTPTVYYQGTIGSITFTSQGFIIFDSGTPGWTTNQWIAEGPGNFYSFHDVTRNMGALISQSDATSIGSGRTCAQGGNGCNDEPVVGDTYQIRRAKVCLDQPGHSGGLLISNNPGGGVHDNEVFLVSTGLPGPVNQTLDPYYEFMDIGPSTLQAILGSADANMRHNVDLYEEVRNQAAQTSATAPFNGTAGNGHGILSRRPTTCTTGVGYWATDEGNWNTTLPANTSGDFYICTSTNTWTLSYTPYTYPHPLVIAPIAPIATFSPTSLNIGSVPQNATSNPSQTVTLTNTGNANLVNTNIVISNSLYTIVNNTCGTPANITNSSGVTSGFTLTPGQSCTFQVTFAPTGLGTFGGSALFSDNSATSPEIYIFSATSTGPAAPTSSNFAGIHIQTGVSRR